MTCHIVCNIAVSECKKSKSFKDQSAQHYMKDSSAKICKNILNIILQKPLILRLFQRYIKIENILKLCLKRLDLCIF